MIVHIGKVDQGTLVVGEAVSAEIDTPRRTLITNNHTATHLMHWALQQVLGAHIRQAGSVVDPSRLRFDFNHHKALSAEELQQIESLVNEKIRENRPVSVYELSYEEAQKKSDIKQFFGDKYGAKVRVIDIDFSKELCGGTHVAQTGVIGFFRILKESSIAAGVRRIEAVTGKAAEEFTQHNEQLAHHAAAQLKASLQQLPEKVSALLEENRHLLAQIKQLRRAALKDLAAQLSSSAQPIGATHLITAAVDLENEELGLLAEQLMKLRPSLVLILGTKSADRCQLLVRVSPDLVQKGIQAVALIKEIAPLIGGTGGGRPDSAQAGGKFPDKLPAAFQHAQQILLKQC